MPSESSRADAPVFRVLGSVELAIPSATPTLVKSERLRRLLGVLLVRHGQNVSTDRLVEAVWPDGEPVHAQAALHSLAYRLRGLLRATTSVSLCTAPPGYVLRVPRSAVDALRFEDLVAAARTASGPAAVAVLLDDALELWRGPAYAEFAEEDFARTEAARLDAVHRTAVEHRAEAAIDLGHLDEAVARLGVVLADEPLDERPWRAMMIALHQLGRPAEALRTYRRFCTLSRSVLGLEPTEQLKRIELAVLRGEPVVDRPPPALLGSRTTATPQNSFVGRERDVAAVDRMLAEGCLITLVGPGGVGKTRLAVEVTARVARRFPDGVLMCDLVGVGDREQLLELLSSTVQAVPDTGVAGADQIVDALAERRALLVLDNCEHVIDDVAHLVDALLARNGRVRVLATSRERLSVAGERVWPLECLPVPRRGEVVSPSVTLFLDRATATHPVFAAPPEQVAEVCRRLEGLPLAIELAAARTNGITVAEILDRLDEQPDVLAARRPRAPRHQSLSSVIQWSYDLLGPVEREVFELLSVLPGDFGLDAAVALARSRMRSDTVIQAVTALAERSLVQHRAVDGRSRYRILDSLRRFGRAKLEERGALDEVRRRHATWAVELAESLDPTTGGFDDHWLERVDQDLAHLRAAHIFQIQNGDTDGALRMTAALDMYAVSSMRSEVYQRARLALGLPGADAHPLAATAHATCATGAWLSGDLVTARALAERAVALATSAPRRFAVGSLAAVAAFERAPGAVAAYDDAIAVALAENALPHALMYRLLQGSVMVQAGCPDDRLHDAVREAVESSSQHLRALGHILEAELAVESSPERALVAYRKAADAAERSGSLYLVYAASMSSALCEAAHGDASRAAATCGWLLHRWQGRLNDTHVARLLRGVVKLLVAAGAHRQAAQLSGAIGRIRTSSFTVAEFDDVVNAAVGEAETALGHEEFAAAATNGCTATRTEAIAFAVSALRAVYPNDSDESAP